MGVLEMGIVGGVAGGIGGIWGFGGERRLARDLG